MSENLSEYLKKVLEIALQTEGRANKPVDWSGAIEQCIRLVLRGFDGGTTLAEAAAANLSYLKDCTAKWEQVFDFHPRVAKLVSKKKPFVVVANDEPYYEFVYSLIREAEKQAGRWTEQDESIFLQALGLVIGAECPYCKESGHTGVWDAHHQIFMVCHVCGDRGKVDAQAIKSALFDNEHWISRSGILPKRAG